MSRLVSFTWKSQQLWGRRGDDFRLDPTGIMPQVGNALSECRDIRILCIEHDRYKDDLFFEVQALSLFIEIIFMLIFNRRFI